MQDFVCERSAHNAGCCVCERSASHVAAYGAETCGRARQCGIRQSGTPSCIIILRMVYYYGILNGILSYIMHHGILSCIMVYHHASVLRVATLTHHS